MHTITSRDFNRDVSAAKRAAENGPVTITDHGRPSHVLITAALYGQLTAQSRPVGGRLRPKGEPADLEIPDRAVDDSRLPDL